ncbi:hypothetical protein BJP36_41135 [Moorena producens JHB]|uniref:Uncharacterized protein n=1 Tax=Moorena producens (strain JHB) TaxID=1454205 RepID=A0A9Q9SSE0_MOOP1|nr:hypothetical protein [Moorena producens]WAN68772.1 hypothetical protein BJP36_41135 [Moorena producens JHB]
MGGTTAVAHGGDHGSRSWGKPRQSLMGGTPKTALPPQDRAASPRPRCLPKTALPPQDRNGAFSVGELNSPRVAPLHRS